MRSQEKDDWTKGVWLNSKIPMGLLLRSVLSDSFQYLCDINTPFDWDKAKSDLMEI